MKKIEFYCRKKMCVNCSNPVYPGLTGFEQLINFVSSSWFPAKSVEQMIVEQSNFEQFTPTREKYWKNHVLKKIFKKNMKEKY